MYLLLYCIENQNSFLPDLKIYITYNMLINKRHNCLIFLVAIVYIFFYNV